MSSFLAQVARLFHAKVVQPSHASNLMEAADNAAGLDARHAQELRAAASAWLRVVR